MIFYTFPLFFAVKERLYLRVIVMSKLESKFQRELINEIKDRYPKAWVEKADANYRQGTPDLRVFIGKFWGALEVKRSSDSPHQPNQDIYVDRLNRMSFARFVYPENKEEVLNEMELALQSSKRPRHPGSK